MEEELLPEPEHMMEVVWWVWRVLERHEEDRLVKVKGGWGGVLE